jgi:hypothetical protein
LSELLVARVAVDLDVVDLLDAVARVGEPVCERSVVRQYERAGGVGVEAPDGDDARLVANKVDDGRPSLRVARSRHDARGLVEEHVGKPLRRDGTTVDFDTVRPLDERVQLPRLAVDGDPSGLDQLVGATTRRDARARQVGVQPHSS